MKLFLSRIGSSRMTIWRKRLLTLALGQSGVQAFGLVTGLLLVRWMSMEAFAQFSVVFGFQVTLGMLVDLGFDGAIISLVAARGQQPAVIGGYIAAARWFRTRMFAILTPLAGIVFWGIGQKHGWAISSQVVLFCCIVGSLYSISWSSWYAAPLLIHHRLKPYYWTQNIVALGRLLACVALKLGGVLSAMTLAILNTAAYAVTAYRYHADACDLVHVPARPAIEARQEMMRYLLPQLPGFVFAAIQGQLTVFLISWFGKSYNIAEVGALARIGQIFAFLAAANGTLIAPYFAQVSAALLPRRYFQVLVLQL